MRLEKDYMIQFRVKGPMHRAPKRGHAPGEACLLRIGLILCLFPASRQIRTTENGWTIDVYEDDWEKVEKSFRSQFLGNEVFAAQNFENNP